MAMAMTAGSRRKASRGVPCLILTGFPYHRYGQWAVTIDKAAGINLGLWVGLTMLTIGVIFLSGVLLKPPAPVTAAEAEAARKAGWKLGRQAPESANRAR